MPSASVATGPSTGAPPAYGLHARGLDADDADVGPQRLDRDRDADGQPAAAERHDDAARGRRCPRAAPVRACPGRRRRPGRRTGGRTPCRRLGELLAAAIASSTVAPPSITIAPKAAARLDLGDRRAGRDEDLARHADAGRRTRSPGRGCRRCPPSRPALTASPSEASLFIAPRILNEPVRCRFSALSTTGRRVVGQRHRRDDRSVLDDGAGDVPSSRMSASVTAVDGVASRPRAPADVVA